MSIKIDGRKNNGGKRLNAGRKKVDPNDIKVTIPFQVKKKHIEIAKELIKPLIDKINLS